jgi:PAS domain S-box-containing protein
MIGQGVAALQEAGLKHDTFHPAATLLNREECGTLVLDGMGRIRSCGAAGERIFGASQVRLIGRRISEFIAGLFLGVSSPSYNARYLVYLCADGEWRKFEAVDAEGHGFAVELNLSRMTTDGQEIFMLNVRRPEEGNGA